MTIVLMSFHSLFGVHEKFIEDGVFWKNARQGRIVLFRLAGDSKVYSAQRGAG